MSLSNFLAREQRAFLGRSHRTWGNHLRKARTFFGEALEQAPRDQPVLILGAGSGLEIPWSKAPRHTVGWDADPWSRFWTLCRHRRFPEWVFGDFTGGMADFEAVLQRAQVIPGRGQRRDSWKAVERLAGLLPSLSPRPKALEAWMEQHQPGTVILANVLGQIGVLAQRLVEVSLGDVDLWDEDREDSQRLILALDAWTQRTLLAVLQVVESSGAQVWMIHDRVVIWGAAAVSLGSLHEDWRQQLHAQERLEASDPLCGLDPGNVFEGRSRLHFDRWFWFLAQGQLHLMEAMAYSSKGSLGQLGRLP